MLKKYLSFILFILTSNLFALTPMEARKNLENFSDIQNPDLKGVLDTIWAYRIPNASQLTELQWDSLHTLVDAGELHHLEIQQLTDLLQTRLEKFLQASYQHGESPSREYGPMLDSPASSTVSMSSAIESGLQVLTLHWAEGYAPDIKVLELLSSISTLDTLLLMGTGEFLEGVSPGELPKFPYLQTLAVGYRLGTTGMPQLANLVECSLQLSVLNVALADIPRMDRTGMLIAYTTLAEALGTTAQELNQRDLSQDITIPNSPERRRSSVLSIGGSLTSLFLPPSSSGLNRANDSFLLRK